MKYQFTAEALSDYESAVVYYERQEPGLGARFILELEELLATLLEFPRMTPAVRNAPAELELRLALLDRFGVEIAYQISTDTLVIISVFHGSREPDFWRRRIK